jgi:hypothetical protein
LATGRLELVTAALTGRLHLDKGQVLRLVPHARAASAMLREAGGVVAPHALSQRPPGPILLEVTDSTRDRS